MFGRWKRKDGHGNGHETEQLEEDEWFIPYNRQSKPPPTLGGIGQMPGPSRAPASGLGSGSGSRLFPRRPAFPRSGSDGSLTRPPLIGGPGAGNEQDRIPSSTSVPTGLAAPKLLFSPLSREMRSREDERNRHDQSQAKVTPTKSGGTGESNHRRRAVSMPKHGTTYEPRSMAAVAGSSSHRWAAPTMCDMLVFPRPQITAHTITPPASPGRMSSMFDGLSMAEKVDREKERQDWQRYAAETKRMPSLSRKGSKGRARNRSASVGAAAATGDQDPSRWSSSKSRGKGKQRDDDQRDEAHRSAPPAVTSFAFAKRPSQRRFAAAAGPEHQGTEAEAYRRRHQHSKSTSDLVQSSRTRTRVKIAPQSGYGHDHEDDDQGVIVIGPGDTPSRSNPDFTKPLPPLPDEYRLRYNPSSPFKPFDNIATGTAISTPAAVVIVDSTTQGSQQRAKERVDPFIAHGASQPQRSDTTTTSASARAMLAKQHQRAVNKRAFNSPRPRQRESSNTSSVYSQASHRTSTMSAVSPLRRMTAMEEAIGRSRAANQPKSEHKQPAPAAAAEAMPALGMPLDATSPLRADALGLPGPMSPGSSSVTTPRPRRLSLESQTPSPRPGQYDEFKGLFFRTPREPQIMRFDSSMGRTVPVPPRHDGLGFETEEDRRQSASDDSTVEIATPTTMRAVKGSYAGYSMEPVTAAIPESCSVEFASPPPISAAFMASSTDTSPASTQSLARQPDGDCSDGDDFIIGHAPIHPVVKIGTPQGSDVTATKRRSIVPSVGDSPGSVSTLAMEEYNLLNHKNSSHRLNHASSSDRLEPIGASPERRPSQASSGVFRRDSTAVSFIDDFPSPPHLSQPAFESTPHAMPSKQPQHATAFGQLVTGPPGAGKTTYCHGMHQFLTALERPVHIVNLDPAVTDPPYPCAISITSLITLDQVMEEYGLGPNGAMLYCIEYLEANFDWLVEQLDELLLPQGGNGYVIFDTPGQVELWTNHDSLKNIVEKLQKMDYRLAAVHLSDAHYIVDATKFISVVLLALRAMMQLELPHVNVLSKIDLLSTYGELPFDLRYYTEVQDMSYLLDSLDRQPRMGKFKTLNKAMVELVEEYGMVGFETLAVEDKTSMMKLLRQLDKATGYIYVPSSASGSTSEPNTYGLFTTAQADTYLGDVDDVQERWIDNKEMWDEREKEEWQKEGEMRAAMRGGSDPAPPA